MFNSFYESLPPIEIGKNKLLALFSGYVIYMLTFVCIIALIIAKFIMDGFSLKDDLFLILIIFILGYSVIRVIYTASSTLPLAYTNKTYKLSYNNILLLKRGLVFQLFFALLILIIYFSKSLNSQTSPSITLVVAFILLSLFALETGIFFMAYNQIAKPFKAQIRDNFMKQQNPYNPNPKGPNFPFNSPFTSKQPFSSSKFGHDNGLSQRPKMTKEQEEAMVRSANVPVIDISDELDERKLSTNDKENDDDSSKSQNDGTSISAF